ncbi:cytochrome P450 [Xylariaceae sp. FL0804]|nr:cytochrome P450 [Xylariaceae sp. FL0804]
MTLSAFTEQNLYLGGGALVLLGVLVVLIFPSRDPLAHIPGPWYARWTDLVHTYYGLAGKGPSWIHSLHDKYGPVVRVSTREVFVADPAAAAPIYRVKGEFPKSDFYSKILPHMVNVFSTRDVQEHRRIRRMISSPLSESGLKTFMPQIDAKVRLAIQRMGEEQSTRGAADVWKWWLFLATDVIGELSFGEGFRMLESRQINQYILDLRRLGPLGAVRAAFPRLMRLAIRYRLPIPLLRDAASTTNRITDYTRTSLERHRDLTERHEAAVRPTLLSRLYQRADADEKVEEDDRLRPHELRSTAQSFIVAGSDTTSNTLTYLVWAVCGAPRIRDKLVAELLTTALPSVVGGSGTRDDDREDEVAYADVRDLPYLNCVVDETLRLHGAAPAGLPREVPAGGVDLLTAGGERYHVPAGYTVAAQSYSLHRDPRAFPDPESFVPERWERPTRAMKEAFMPFGGGSRICVGLHLAKVELRLAAALFFRTFPRARVSTREGFSDADMDKELYFLIAPKGHRCLIDLSPEE